MPRATTRPSVLKDVPQPTPRLADALRSLSETQLQTQAARSAALDTGAIGVMSLDCALADKTQPLIGATCLTGLAMAIDLIGLVR